MNEFNIITTYYNNKDHLNQFVKDFLYHKQKYSFLKLYIIDDGSKQHPAKEFLIKHKDIELYEVTEDLGFNSHGCRNLGMTVSDKDWNLLLDCDINLIKIRMDMVVNWEVVENDVIDLSLNCLLIHKKTFFSCNGYDEELVNIHAGDRLFIKYLSDNFNYEAWNARKVGLIYNRSGRNLILSNKHKITTYDDKNLIYYGPYETYKHLDELNKFLKKRYEDKNFQDKKILNFNWNKIW